jgi:hypothetical protein
MLCAQVVYYMPHEEVFKKDEISRELCLVLHGACHLVEDDKVKRIVRDDVSPPRASHRIHACFTPRRRRRRTRAHRPRRRTEGLQ